ncbi:MAG: transglycosylase SLT domain-containing protein [Oligoflexales bacterium]|nr:transglycosylase SLT domain-containing protein [Oligoflexales bacterium]
MRLLIITVLRQKKWLLLIVVFYLASSCSFKRPLGSDSNSDMNASSKISGAQIQSSQKTNSQNSKTEQQTSSEDIQLEHIIPQDVSPDLALELEAADYQNLLATETEEQETLEKDIYVDILCDDPEYFDYLQKNIRKSDSSDSSQLSQRVSCSDSTTLPAESPSESEAASLSESDTAIASEASAALNVESFPLTHNESVEKWIRFFTTRGRSHFQKWIERGQQYRTITEQILSAEGLPKELFYLAMIESGFSNHAYSRARATGMWQFMKGTAQLYGLNINHWVDERRDPYKATLAASRFLKDLYNLFGDWHLAMAAYNAGPGKIQKAIRGVRAADFWRIAASKYIRRETKDYVPKIMAAIHIHQNLDSYGFTLAENVAVFPHKSVKVERPIKLAELAVKLNVSDADLTSWNPSLRQAYTPPERKGGFFLRLPEELVSVFNEIKDSLGQITVVDMSEHIIRKGETLSSIAVKYKLTVKKILAFNPDLDSRRLRIGKRIAIPLPDVRVSAGSQKSII